LRFHKPCVEKNVSGRRLCLGFDLMCMIANQTEYRHNAFAALSATATGLVDIAKSLTAACRDGLLHSFIGQRIAQADIHDMCSI
jgi:hypothetical protein